MKLAHTLLAITLFSLFAANAVAGDAPLTKEMIDRLSTVSAETDKLSEKYPEIDDMSIEMMSKGGKEIAKYLKGTKAIGEIKKIAKSNGFSSVDELTNYLFRLMSAQAAIGLEQMPPGFDEEQMKAAFEQQKQMMASQREQMLKMGMPEKEVDAKIAEGMENMEKSMRSFKFVKLAAVNAKPADIEFVKANQQYIEEKMNIEEQ